MFQLRSTKLTHGPALALGLLFLYEASQKGQKTVIIASIANAAPA
jgi:hypothetical protein